MYFFIITVYKLYKVFKSSSESVETFDAVGREEGIITMQDQVDFDLLISSLPKGLVTEKTIHDTDTPKEMDNGKCIYSDMVILAGF